MRWPPPRHVWPIYAAIALNGVVRAFLGPVYNALFARVCRASSSRAAPSIGSVVFQTGLVVGPALGGVLVGWAGSTWPTVAAAFGVRGVAICRDCSVTEPAPVLQRGPIFASIGEGLRFVFNHQIVLGAHGAGHVRGAVRRRDSLMPAFINDILHYGPEGARHPARGAGPGAVAGRRCLARRPPQRNAGRVCCSPWPVSACASSASRCRGSFGFRR